MPKPSDNPNPATQDASTAPARPRLVPCPHCGTEAAWSTENRFRPFCSERCRAIDLGAWAAGDYRVPVVEEPEQPDQEP